MDDRNADLADLLRRLNGEWSKETRDAGAQEALAGFSRQVVKIRLESAEKELGGLAATADWPAMARLAEKVAGQWREEAQAAVEAARSHAGVDRINCSAPSCSPACPPGPYGRAGGGSHLPSSRRRHIESGELVARLWSAVRLHGAGRS